jgi:hypothetical protein
VENAGQSDVDVVSWMIKAANEKHEVIMYALFMAQTRLYYNRD